MAEMSDFEEAVSREIAAIRASSTGMPSTYISPDSSQAERDEYHEALNKAVDQEASGIYSLFSFFPWLAGVGLADWLDVLNPYAAPLVGVGGTIITCGYFMARSARSNRKLKTVESRPGFFIKIPGHASAARDKFSQSVAALEKLPIPDDVRLQIAEARTSMDRLSLAVGRLDVEDVHTSERLTDEMLRMAAEASVTLSVAQMKADMVKGLNPDEMIELAGRVSLAGAVDGLLEENKHIAHVLDQRPAADTSVAGQPTRTTTGLSLSSAQAIR